MEPVACSALYFRTQRYLHKPSPSRPSCSKSVGVAALLGSTSVFPLPSDSFCDLPILCMPACVSVVSRPQASARYPPGCPHPVLGPCSVRLPLIRRFVLWVPCVSSTLSPLCPLPCALCPVSCSLWPVFCGLVLCFSPCVSCLLSCALCLVSCLLTFVLRASCLCVLPCTTSHVHRAL